MKDKVLITGAQGFIGRNLYQKLESKYEILTFEESDIKENWVTTLIDLMSQKPKAVFHVGACSDTLEQDVNYMMLVNYEITKCLTELCFNYKIPIIYSSSAANYGVNNQHPSNLYGWSKYAAEGYVTSNRGVGLRYFNVYGPGEEDKGRMASVAYQMFKRNQNGEDIKLFPKKPLRDFVYIKDIVAANIYAFENYDKLHSKWYEVGSGEARGFEDKLEIMDIPFTYHSEDAIPEGYQFYTCSNKNEWMPGWKSKYNLERGLKDYLEYLV